MKVFLNGKIVDERKATISIFDHGFLYGDGLYETVAASHYELPDWPAHARRLKRNLKTLGMACPWSMREVRDAVIRTLRANQQPHGSARITVSRGVGPLGLDPTRCLTPTLTIALHPKRPVNEWRERGVTLMLSSVPYPGPALVSSIKGTSVVSSVLAKAEATRRGAFEAVRLTDRGFLTEGTTTNLFFVRGGRLYTPSLDTGILNGITRQRVLRFARQKRWVVSEGFYRVAALDRADEIFLTNSTFCVLPVVTWMAARRRRVGDGRPGPLARQLLNAMSYNSISYGRNQKIKTRAS